MELGRSLIKRMIMTKKEWTELEDGSEISAQREAELLKRTELVDEHPEDYDGPCFCRLCLSYGD